MQQIILELLNTAIDKLRQDGVLSGDRVAVDVVPARAREHGDFSSNVAMLLAAQEKKNPLEVAKTIAAALPASPYLKKAQAVAPGFINFYLADAAFYELICQILDAGEHYGHSNIGADKMALVEFVSANPTGPLHVGHGRGAAFGDTVADLLEAVGYKVQREYYVNDAGRQMHVLALSVWLRYLELCGETLHFPFGGYKGAYVTDIARPLFVEYENKFRRRLEELYFDLPVDAYCSQTGFQGTRSIDPSSLIVQRGAREARKRSVLDIHEHCERARNKAGNQNAMGIDDGGDKELYVDAMLVRMQKLLAAEDYQIIFQAGLKALQADIKEDLEEFGVIFQEWFTEGHLLKNGDVTKGIEKLKQNQCTYMKDGALWFKATDFGDEKDRVLVRANGQSTYFASDIGYHLNKYERGFDLLLDVFGSDHHGYVPRIKAFLKALQLDASKLKILLVQFAILYRGKEKVSMSTRGGEFVTLRQLREEVGNDAARFFYIMRKNDQHLDFDLELAKAQSLDNPVYYIQYAHARICSVMRQVTDRQLEYSESVGLANLPLLQSEAEIELLQVLMNYQNILQQAALRFEPHLLANYLRALAGAFHTYYGACQFLVADVKLLNARLCLINAAKQVLANGLKLLGVSCPEAM